MTGRDDHDDSRRGTYGTILDASVLNYIRRLVDEAPELTDDQRQRLALLLRTSTPTNTTPYERGNG